ncbi:MAG: SDR family NAD(P)-dependent oxidoreductase [Actinomycetales bacterium]|nr:SDR family NAD(P)-dependent oxidoreductase [Actinomycetales bacterium]
MTDAPSPAFVQVPKHLKWTAADMPDLTGRLAIVTGANSGLGWWTTRALAEHGAQVTMAVRNQGKGQAAAAQMPGSVEVEVLDLADLGSVRAFAERWSAAHPQGLDLLINNAGIMAVPRRLTADGYETQFATNHLGHFALTGLLLPALAARPNTRVVTVSSQAHRFGRMQFDDLMGERRYNAWRAYGQSKLANLLFTSELQRRLDLAGLSITACAAHPGFAATNLIFDGFPGVEQRSIADRIKAFGSRTFAQSAEQGALPTLFAATYPGLPGDTYVGPDGFGEQRGHPRIVARSAPASDPEDARRLWQLSEELTGITYPFD